MPVSAQGGWMHSLGLGWSLPLHQDLTGTYEGPLTPPAVLNGPVNYQQSSQPLFQPVIGRSPYKRLWHKTTAWPGS